MDENGSISFTKTKKSIDICINGMVLDYASYFTPYDKRIELLIDYLLSIEFKDGGYSWNKEGYISDPDATIAVLEGFLSYRMAGLKYRVEEIKSSEKKAIEFLLSNNLFMVGDKSYTKLSYPYRYKYNVLRVLEYLANAKIPYDDRMFDALNWLNNKQKSEGVWYLENIYIGNTHFKVEEKNKASRFITLKAKYILKYYKIPLNYR
jgi:hypothetical protein